MRGPAPEDVLAAVQFVRAFELVGENERRLSTGLAGADGAFSLAIPAERGARLRFTDLGGTCAEQELVLAPPLSPAPLEVVLESRAERLPALDGLVVGPRGEPIEGCAVTLRPPEDSLCGCIAFHVRTDATGAFRFEQLSDGPHRLIVSDARFQTAIQYPAHAGDHVLIELRARRTTSVRARARRTSAAVVARSRLFRERALRAGATRNCGRPVRAVANTRVVGVRATTVTWTWRSVIATPLHSTTASPVLQEYSS